MSISNPLVDSVMLYKNSFLRKINRYPKGPFGWSKIENVENRGEKTNFMNVWLKRMRQRKLVRSKYFLS